jgi:hypothetical protein
MNDFPKPQHGRRSAMSMPFGLILKLAMVGASVRPAAAQTSVDAGNVPSAAAQEGDASGVPDPFSDTWKFTLGGGVVNGPRYPGSRYDFTRGLPLVSVSYGRFFLGAVPGGGAPAGAGAYLVHTEHWAIGLDVGGDSRKPRRATDDPILRGWGDIPGTARAGVFASYTRDWLSVGQQPVRADFLRHQRRSKRDRRDCTVSSEERDQHGGRVRGRRLHADRSLVTWSSRELWKAARRRGKQPRDHRQDSEDVRRVPHVSILSGL